MLVQRNDKSTFVIYL